MKQMDLTKGPIFKTLLIYSLPLIATNVVQLLFHAADVFVLGVMANDNAVAAVGACGALINLLISLFSGLATGANVLVARKVGAKDEKGARKATGVSLVVGFLSGVILMIIAITGAKQFLIWMKCQPEVLKSATLYLRIYFAGMPILMLYNFVSAILRSVGDSLRPMLYMLIGGVLNVGLNFIFIGGFHMEVEGVALATVISNLFSLILAIIALIKNNGYCKIEIKNLRLRKTELYEIVRVGVPSSVTGLFYYVSNIFVSTAVNSMGTKSMTANAISNQFDGIIYQLGLSIAIACMAMVGQSLGALNFDRVIKTVKISLAYVTLASLSFGTIVVLLAKPVLGLMTSSHEVLEIAREKLFVLCLTYFITSIMEVFSFSLRAMRSNTITLIVGFVCGLLIRSGWVLLVWERCQRIGVLYLSYGVSALAAAIIYFFYYRYKSKNLEKELKSI